jgi:hypothetical protein
MRGSGAGRVIFSFELERRRLHDHDRVLDQAAYKKEEGREGGTKWSKRETE